MENETEIKDKIDEIKERIDKNIKRKRNILIFTIIIALIVTFISPYRIIYTANPTFENNFASTFIFFIILTGALLYSLFPQEKIALYKKISYNLYSLSSELRKNNRKSIENIIRQLRKTMEDYFDEIDMEKTLDENSITILYSLRNIELLLKRIEIALKEDSLIIYKSLISNLKDTAIEILNNKYIDRNTLGSLESINQIKVREKKFTDLELREKTLKEKIISSVQKDPRPMYIILALVLSSIFSLLFTPPVGISLGIAAAAFLNSLKKS